MENAIFEGFFGPSRINNIPVLSSAKTAIDTFVSWLTETTACQEPDENIVEIIKPIIQSRHTIIAPANNRQLRKIISNACKLFGYDFDFNWIDVSKITIMEDAFPLKFQGDVSLWDVSNVKDMSCMFCGCQAFNSDLSGWDVSNVKDMGHMFAGCEKFNQDISMWDVSNVERMVSMFSDCIEFNKPLNRWDTSRVTDMHDMFNNCVKFNQDISGWDVTNVVDMGYMFDECVKFNSDISGWDVSNVRNANCMLYHCIRFNQDLSSWNMTNCHKTACMLFKTKIKGKPQLPAGDY